MTAPKVFISYSWSSEEHVDWVIQLATELRSNGVDIILDKWDLKEGNDANAFMEQMVSDDAVQKVIIISDELYARKANDREGGVGTEAQIISPGVYRSANQNKFVVVCTDRDSNGNASVPVFYGSRVYIDMSDEDVFVENFEQLLRWIFDKPIHPKPVIGNRPSFLDENPKQAGVSTKLSLAVDAIKHAKPSANSTLGDYFDSIFEELNQLRLEPEEVDDNKIWESIESFKHARDQLSEAFEVLCRCGISSDNLQTLKTFFERFAQYQYRPADVSRFKRITWDNYKFLITEIFLILVSRMIKWQRFEELNSLLAEYYFLHGENGGQGSLRSFAWFNLGIESFDFRKRRLQLNRSSLRADLLKQRCETGKVTFAEIMQADLFLYLRTASDEVLRPSDDSRLWRASTLIFAGYSGAAEVFLRATSIAYFDKIKNALGMSSLADFNVVMLAINERSIGTPFTDYGRIDVLELANNGAVATKP